MTGQQQYAQELLAGIDSPEQLLRLWADGEQVLRGYRPPPLAVEVRIGELRLEQHVALFCHEVVKNAKVEDPLPAMPRER